MSEFPDLIAELVQRTPQHAERRSNVALADSSDLDRAELQRHVDATADQLRATIDEAETVLSEAVEPDDELRRLTDFASAVHAGSFDREYNDPALVQLGLLLRRDPANGAIPDLIRDPAAVDRLAALARDKGEWERARLDLEDAGFTRDHRERLERVIKDRAKQHDKAERAPRSAPAADKRGFTFDDKGNARRLVVAHGSDLRFIPGEGWHAWDGTRWRPDDTGEVMRRAKQVADDLWDEANAQRKAGADSDTLKAIMREAMRAGQRPRLEAMIALAESEREVVARADQLDTNPLVLNVANGTVDLRTGKLQPHNRGDLLTKLAGAPYDPDAKCPRWQQFLTEIFDTDTELIAYVQRAVGYSLTGDTSEQCLFLAHGDGANGKTTLVEAIAAALGDYARSADPSSFTQDHRRSVRSDLARLRGARYVTGVEVEQGARFAESLVKQVTGGDRITVAHLYQGEFEYRPTWKLWLALNHLPQVDPDSRAIWRRLRVIPFPRNFDGHPDKQLTQRLRAELPGILAWAVAGCVAWQQHGLGEPIAVQDATQHYRGAQTPDADPDKWIHECCDLDPLAWTATQHLRQSYETWAGQQGTRPTDLSRWLTTRRFEDKKKNGQRGYYGLRLRTNGEST